MGGAASGRHPGLVRREMVGGRPVAERSGADLPASLNASRKCFRALRIARAIGDNYAFRPSRPLDVAAALSVQPSSGPFRMLAGASASYGLTAGGYNAASISVTPLAKRILEPTMEGDDFRARREAILRPRVMREFLTKYDGAKLPREDIARNVLIGMGVPRDSVERTLKLILDSAGAVGFLQEIKGATYVNLQPEHSAPAGAEIGAEETGHQLRAETVQGRVDEIEVDQPSHTPSETAKADTRSRRVSIRQEPLAHRHSQGTLDVWRARTCGFGRPGNRIAANP